MEKQYPTQAKNKNTKKKPKYKQHKLEILFNNKSQNSDAPN